MVSVNPSVSVFDKQAASLQAALWVISVHLFFLLLRNGFTYCAFVSVLFLMLMAVLGGKKVLILPKET